MRFTFPAWEARKNYSWRGARRGGSWLKPVVRRRSGPVAAVEGPILDGLGEVGYGEVLDAFEVGDGTRDFEDAVVGAGGESLLLHGALEEALGVGAQLAVGANLAGGHLRVGVDLLAEFSKSLPLAFAGSKHTGANLGRALDGRRAAQFLIFNGRDFDVNVDAVEKRAGDLGHVTLNHGRGALALAGLVVEEAAGAGIHGRGEHKARGEANRHGGAGDGDGVVFQGLAQDLEDVAGKLRKLVEEEQAVVSQRDLAGSGDDAAADQSGVGDGVMRRAEGALGDEALCGVEDAGDGVNLGGFQRLIEGERGEDGGQALGQHGFARAGRADHENVMAAGGGHLEGALGRLLAAHVLEVQGEVLQLAEQGLSGDAIGLALNDAHDHGVEQLQHVEQRGGGKDVDALDDGGFGGVGSGQNQVGNAFFAGHNGHRQHSRNRAHAAVKAQFADQEKAAQVGRGQCAISAQDADGDGQIEAGAFLFQVGGGQVDGDVGGRYQVTGVLNGGADAVAALAHRGVGQADGVEVVLVGDNAAVVHLDIDEVGVNSVNSRAVSLEKHGECSQRV